MNELLGFGSTSAIATGRLAAPVSGFAVVTDFGSTSAFTTGRLAAPVSGRAVVTDFGSTSAFTTGRLAAPVSGRAVVTDFGSTSAFTTGRPAAPVSGRAVVTDFGSTSAFTTGRPAAPVSGRAVVTDFGSTSAFPTGRPAAPVSGRAVSSRAAGADLRSAPTFACRPFSRASKSAVASTLAIAGQFGFPPLDQPAQDARTLLKARRWGFPLSSSSLICANDLTRFLNLADASRKRASNVTV